MSKATKYQNRHLLCSVFLACLTTFALGLDMSVEMPVELIETMRDGLFGWIDNLIIMFNHFHTMDHLTGAVVTAGLCFVYFRWIMPCNEKHSLGEYALSGFFAFTMLISEVLSAENSIKALWNGGTQLMKAAIVFAGLWPLFLAGIRALAEGLQLLENMKGLKEGTFWERHPFLCPFVLMALCWLPLMVMKYPGGMSPDVTVQILDWQNGTMELSHPPLTTVAYGVFYDLGIKLGNPNTGIFLFTLLQTVCFLCVLAYSCVRMRAWNVPKAVYTTALAAYCLLPNYSGWTTTLVKDVPYLIACILLCVLLIDFSLNARAFCFKPLNHVLLILAGVTVWLWRRNGIGMALGCGIFMAIAACRKGGMRCFVRLTASVALTAAVALGCNTALTKQFDYRPAAQRETYSHLLQATGRVVIEHPDAYTEEEIGVISRVMSYDDIKAWYSPIITDGMKALFIEEASEEEYAAFRELVARKAAEYPVEYVDSYINLIYRLFDWRSDRGDYIGRREISHPYYIRSYTNLLYDQQMLQELNAAQEAVENWHFWFADLPLGGLLVNIGFCVDVMLAMVWIMVKKKRKRALSGLIPAMLTAVFCLFSPLVYIRYAVPITATLPLWFAAYTAHGNK